MVDGVEIDTRRVTSGPYVYTLDTGMLSKGTHTLQVWAHDQNNVTLLSDGVVITVQ